MAVGEFEAVNVVGDAVTVAARRIPWVRSLLVVLSVLAVASVLAPRGRVAWVAVALRCIRESSQAWAAAVPALQAAFTPRFPHA